MHSLIRPSAVALACLATSLDAAQERSANRPNIVLLMADDLGWGDVGFNGNRIVQTPHLDRLAADGVRLSRFYAAAPVCSPTRASCLTGRHPYRMGITWAFAGALPAREVTIAEALPADYMAAHFGKWHVGLLSRTVKQGYAPGDVDPKLYSPPWQNGFDECFSVLNAVPSFNPYYLTCGAFGSDGYRLVMDRPVARGQRTGGFVWRDRFWSGPGKLHDQWLQGPVPEILVDRTIDFARRAHAAGRPFLAAVWFSTPHTPVVAGPRHREPYAHRPIREQHWYGCITAMDEQIGRLQTELANLGVDDDTLLVFCSDNGPTWVHELGKTGGLRGRKGSLWEGGIRVPAFLRWPSRVEGGRSCAEPVSTSDLLPTVLAATGGGVPQDRVFDGEDVLPILAGAKRKRPIGFESPRLTSEAKDTKAWMKIRGTQLAWIDGGFKLLSLDEGVSWMLFDLVADPNESKDLAAKHPRRVTRMRRALAKWRASCAASARGDERGALTGALDGTAVSVFAAGRTTIEGVERSPACYAQFREGGVAVTNTGRIVVVAQGREKSRWSDRSGQDLVCRYSDDDGDTWSDGTLIASFGDHSVCPNATVYDHERDTVHVLYNVFEWDFRDPGSRKPMQRRECRQFHQQSKDGGMTWSPPRDISEMIGSQRYTTVFGSGEGIQLRHGAHAGRLVVPGGFQNRWGNRMFYSDDHGTTWKVGAIAPRDNVRKLNVRLENKVAELSDGTLVLNARHTPQRVRAFSKDGGATWTPEEVDNGLPAVSCNGALLCVQDTAGRDVLLCSVPRGPGRTRGTVYVSLDGGRSWPHAETLIEREFAYSSLVRLRDGRIGLIYEAAGHRDLRLVRFRLSDVAPRRIAPQPVVVFSRRAKFGYRIPALVAGSTGTLLAFCERRIGLHDHAQNDIVLRRSADDGRTWLPEQVLADDGSDSLNDPCVVRLDTGRILLRYKRFPRGVHARKSRHTVMAEPGYGGEKNVRVYLMHSDDDGATWSAARDVTREMRRESVIAVGSPGVAIQLTRGPHAGRIVFPNYETVRLSASKRTWHNSVSFSDDGGATWKLSAPITDGGIAPGAGNEAQLVELTDGSILMSARVQGAAAPGRKLARSTDGGATWSDARLEETLRTPACMSSVLRYSWPRDHTPGLLLHTVPNTKRRRAKGTLFGSRDDGATWSKLCAIEPRGFGYSCLATLSNGDVGCLYETGRGATFRIVFRRISRGRVRIP